MLIMVKILGQILGHSVQVGIKNCKKNNKL